MPRANRVYLQGHLWHITHRCHNKDLLFKDKKSRRRYLYWLKQSIERYNLAVLSYMVTSNHIHLIVCESEKAVISKSMQYVAGRTAQEYNVLNSRKGAFWEDRYHATIIDSGMHLLKCMIYVDLNMVRAGVINHPAFWKESSYLEVVGKSSGNQIINFKYLEEYLGYPKSWWKTEYPKFVLEELNKKKTRDPLWTKSLVVGSKKFVEKLRFLLSSNQRDRVGNIGSNYFISQNPRGLKTL